MYISIPGSDKLWLVSELIFISSELNDRIAIPNIALRKKLASIAEISKNATMEDLQELCARVQDNEKCGYIHSALDFCRCEYSSLAEIPEGIRLFFSCIASPSSVCSYLPPKKNCLEIADELCNSGGNIKKDEAKLSILQKDMPAFFELLNAFPNGIYLAVFSQGGGGYK